MGWNWEIFWYTIIVLALVLAFFLTLWWFFSLKRKGKGPSHVELYFDENFRRIINEWDLTSRDKVKEFKKGMTKRLGKVDTDLSSLESKRKGLDNRLGALEKEISLMEGS